MLQLYKTRLQQFAQKQRLTWPVYSCVTEGPPHDRRFKATVNVDGNTYESQEFFKTLKDAEHAAAKIALETLSPDEMVEEECLCKSLLQELAQKEGLLLPSYSTTKTGPSHKPTFMSTVEIGGETFQGLEAKTKKLAETNAAMVAFNSFTESKPSMYKTRLLNYTRKRNLSSPAYSCLVEGPSHAQRFKSRVVVDGKTYEAPQFSFAVKDSENAAAEVASEALLLDEKPEDRTLYKNLLQEVAQKNGLLLPSYNTTRSGLPNMGTFLSRVEIGGESFQGQEAKTKKQAEISAAKVAYNALLERSSTAEGVKATAENSRQIKRPKANNKIHEEEDAEI